MTWIILDEMPMDAPEDAYAPRPCHTPKCQLCGRFAKSLTLVWTGGAEPEPDYEVGECCKDKR